MLEVEGVKRQYRYSKREHLRFYYRNSKWYSDICATAEKNFFLVSLVNGDVRLTIKEDNLKKKVEASSVNGNVKVAFHQMASVWKDMLKQSLGSINSRFVHYEVSS